MKNLKCVTPVGEFTRKTASPYTHIVVWKSPRAKKEGTADMAKCGGVHARWFKDNGFGVTWHTGSAAAQKATRKYKWDNKAALVGIFSVEAA